MEVGIVILVSRKLMDIYHMGHNAFGHVECYRDCNMNRKLKCQNPTLKI